MTAGGPRDVWIDTDTAIGVPRADVDDGLALVQAFHSPEIRVRGVSTVFGNAPHAKTFPAARAVVERFGPKGLAVHGGAASEAELGVENDAVRAMAAALGERRLCILALGPVTNVASLVRLRPELVPRIDEIVMVAARRPGQRFLSVDDQPTPFPDLNFECDPAGMQVLLDASVRLVFAPWEVSSHVWLTGRDLDALSAASEAGAWIAEQSRDWLAIWERELRAPGFNPFDTLAIAWATHPDLLEHFIAGIRIEQGPNDLPGVAPSKPFLLIEPERGDDGVRRSVIYCFRPKPEFKPLLLERLAGPPSR